jgi:hypothetical protein
MGKNAGKPVRHTGGGGGGEGAVDGVPEEVHGVAAHVTDLACAEVPVHVPFEAVGTGAAGEIGGAVGVVGGGAEPEVVVEALGWGAVADGVAVAADLAVAPGVGGFEFADGAVADEFFDAVEVGAGVALHADLGGEFGGDGAHLLVGGAAVVHGDGDVFADGESTKDRRFLG